MEKRTYPMGRLIQVHSFTPRRQGVLHSNELLLEPGNLIQHPAVVVVIPADGGGGRSQEGVEFLMVTQVNVIKERISHQVQWIQSQQ